MEKMHRGGAAGLEESATSYAERSEGRAAHEEPLGLYVHIPFCEKKCPYCDFNTYAKLDDLFQSYVDALCAELAMWAERVGDRRLHTIFLGGGTPTLLALPQLAQIFHTITSSFRLAPGCEITSEANPGTVDRAKFAGLRELGVNRLSMGVQSFDAAELTFLGRIHSVADVEIAFDAARSAGFDNINLDFIFGLPDQSPAVWARTMARALVLAPEHLSLYSLIVEPETPLFHWVETGRVPAPDDDVAGELYEMALEGLGEAGYVQYEVSNWAKGKRVEIRDGGLASDAQPNLQSPISTLCAHNLLYWRNQEYIGVGPGAHSHMRLPFAHPTADSTPAGVGLRWGNRKPVPGYIRRVQGGETVIDFWEEIDSRAAMGETMMLGLRLVEEGVSRDRFQQRHGTALDTVFSDELARLVAQGLLIDSGDRVLLTRRGLMVGNQVFMAFLP